MKKPNKPCVCGAGLKVMKSAIMLTPHSLGCPVLAACCAKEERGICGRCDKPFRIRRGWDDRMGMVHTSKRCMKCARCSDTWLPPTKSEIKEFGLIRKKAKK